MFKNTRAFSGFSVSDLAVAKHFYGTILELEIEDDPMGLILKIAGGTSIYMYHKPAHLAATYTILNFPVDSIENALAELKRKGVKVEHYPGLTDADGIARGRAHNRGPDIAWFKDPSGNILSVLQEN